MGRTYREFLNEKLEDPEFKKEWDALKEDPFFSESNMKSLMKSKEQIKKGKVVVKAMEELEAMASE